MVIEQIVMDEEPPILLSISDYYPKDFLKTE